MARLIISKTAFCSYYCLGSKVWVKMNTFPFTSAFDHRKKRKLSDAIALSPPKLYVHTSKSCCPRIGLFPTTANIAVHTSKP